MREADLNEVALRGMSERERRARAGLLHFDRPPLRPPPVEFHDFDLNEALVRNGYSKPLRRYVRPYPWGR